jgi:hypothetical protein
MTKLILGVVLLACGVARAQEAQPQPARGKLAADAPPLVRLDVRGAAAWRACMLPTNLGSMLASAEGEMLLQPLLAAFDRLWQRLDPAAQQAARARFLAFSGQLSLALWMEDITGTGRPALGVFCVAAEHTSELESLAQDVARWLELFPTRKEHELAGRKFMVTGNDHMACTLPQVIDNRVVVVVADTANDLAAAAQRGLPWAAQESKASATAPPAAPPLRLTVDLAQAVAAANGGGGAWIERLGLLTLRTFTFTIGAQGPHVSADCELAFAPGERGLFAAFFPERAGVPRLGDLVPEGTVGWKVGRFDPMALWRTGLRVAAADDQRTQDEVLAEAKKECNGVDVGAEVLAHLGDEVVVLWRDDAGEQAQVRHVSLCLAMPIVGGDKVATGVREAVSKSLAASGLEVTTHDGVLRTEQAGGWMFPPIHLAVGRGLALVAVGHAGDEQIDSVLARSKPRQPAAPLGAEPPPRKVPAGWNSVGALSLHTLLRYHLEFLFDGVDELVRVIPIEGRHAERWLEPWFPLLEKHDLMRVGTQTGCAEGKWCLRVLW